MGVEKWLVFGGSWGSTLALALQRTHPDPRQRAGGARRLHADEGGNCPGTTQFGVSENVSRQVGAVHCADPG